MKQLLGKLLTGILVVTLIMPTTAIMEDGIEPQTEIVEIMSEGVSQPERKTDILSDMIDMDVAEAEDVEFVDEESEWIEESEAFDLEVDEEEGLYQDFFEGQDADEVYGAEILKESGTSVAVNSSNFPDGGFRQYVSEYIDTNPKDGTLSAAEIANVKRIALLEAGFGAKGEREELVESLKGIEYFTELTYLECFRCGLTSLDLSRNTKLTYLNCAMNGLTSLNISKNTELSVLACYGNSFIVLNISIFHSIVPIVTDQYKMKKQFSNEDYFIAYSKSLLNLSDEQDTIWGLTGPFLAHDTTAAMIIDNPLPTPTLPSQTSTGTSTTASTEDPDPVAIIPATKRSSKMTVTAAPDSWCMLDLGNAVGYNFKSSKKKVATVDSTGMVTIHGAGKTYITFKVGKRSRKVKLTVKDPTVPSSVSLNMSGIITVHKGDTVTLVPSIPARTNSTFKWSTNKKRVATVSNGVVTFKRSGKVTITVTCTRGKKKAKVKFKVIK